MGTQIADRIDDLATEDRGRQPAVEGAGHAVLPNHQSGDRGAQCLLHQLHGLNVVDAEHLPVGQAAGGANRCRGSNPVVIVQFLKADQFRSANGHRQSPKLQAVGNPTATAAGKYRTAFYRGLHIVKC
ncbi:hypothetical protein D3C78_1386960 [compost metagenome]